MKQSTILTLLSFVFVCLLPGCAGKSDRTLEQEAKSYEKDKNYALAIDRYTELVDRFTETALAESCQYRIATLYSNELRDPRNAVRAYVKFNTLYPKSTNAPVALFLAGFMLNNEVHDIDSARAVYTTFMQTYPNHELASSAKYELDNLGKDPGELIAPETATETRPGKTSTAERPTR